MWTFTLLLLNNNALYKCVNVKTENFIEWLHNFQISPFTVSTEVDLQILASWLGNACNFVILNIILKKKLKKKMEYSCDGQGSGIGHFD